MMLSCSLARCRLAALADPGDAPPDLAAHVRGCSDCAAHARTIADLDRLIARLPVPPASPAAKRRAVALVSAGPIIVPRPTPVAPPSILTRLGRYAWESRESWQYVAGVAAVLAVGVTLYVTGPRGPLAEVAAPRHELLASSVKSLARLSTASTAEERLDIWSDVTQELVDETSRVHVAAAGEDLDALDRMFAKAVNEGVVKQARQLPPNLTPHERRERLKRALGRAEQLEAATRVLSERAPVQAVPALRNLAQTAAAGRKALAAVARPEA